MVPQEPRQEKEKEEVRGIPLPWFFVKVKVATTRKKSLLVEEAADLLLNFVKISQEVLTYSTVVRWF